MWGMGFEAVGRRRFVGARPRSTPTAVDGSSQLLVPAPWDVCWAPLLLATVPVVGADRRRRSLRAHIVRADSMPLCLYPYSYTGRPGIPQNQGPTRARCHHAVLMPRSEHAEGQAQLVPPPADHAHRNRRESY